MIVGGLSLPKISPGLDSLGKQNHCIIGYDACDPAFARDVRRRHSQVATQAGSRHPGAQQPRSRPIDFRPARRAGASRQPSPRSGVPCVATGRRRVRQLGTQKTLSLPLSLSQIKSVRIDGAILQARADLGCTHDTEWPFGWAHPSLMKGGCAPHCNTPGSTGGCGEGAARLSPQYDPGIPGGSSRSDAPHSHSAKVSVERLDDRESRTSERGGQI
jgi:hypothetical protein